MIRKGEVFTWELSKELMLVTMLTTAIELSDSRETESPRL